MTQVLYVVHGMRKGVYNDLLHNLISTMTEQLPYAYRIAFLESAETTPEDVVVNMLATSKDNIIVVPLLLFSARHYTHDVQGLVQWIQQTYPSIYVHCTPPIALHTKVIAWLVRQIRHAQRRMLTETSMCKRAVVILTHGSPHTTLPDRQLQSIVEQCQDCFGTSLHVYAASYYGALDYERRLKDLSQRYDALDVIPLFLYDGFIVHKLKRQINDWALPCAITMGHALNFDTCLHDILIDYIVNAEVTFDVSYTAQLVT